MKFESDNTDDTNTDHVDTAADMTDEGREVSWEIFASLLVTPEQNKIISISFS